MRHDKQVNPDHNLLPRQAFFSSCWFNMVHERSLDSYRVRTMNPQNILRELLVMFEPHANDHDRMRVAQEAVLILSEKHILIQPTYAGLVMDILALLASVIGKKEGGESADKRENESQKEKGRVVKNGTLIQALARELLHHLDQRFIQLSLEWLHLATNNMPNAQCSVDEENLALLSIDVVTGNLLSSLVDKGWSLESLFILHQRILIPALPLRPKAGVGARVYSFAAAFAEVRARLVSAQKFYTVIFSIINVSKPDLFPAQIAGIKFQTVPPDVGDTSNDYAKSYAKPAGNKLFATVTVEAQDGRAAGMKASEKIGHILDLVRFEYERRDILLKEQFLLEKEGGRFTRLTIPTGVPNPNDGWQPAELAEFVQQLEELASSGTLPQDAKDRIYSAFRLYRLGADTRNFENKLVNWWTATEFLVKGGNGGPIGDGVETALVPVLSLTYLPKHLIAFKTMFAQIKIEVREPQTGAAINFRELTLTAFYQLLTLADMEIEIADACAGSSYLWMKLRPFIAALKDPEKLEAMLRSHEEKLGWNIQRIYRARCDIVHSAQRRINAALLCAHLEFYLKVALRAFLQSLHAIPTLRDPKEFFERQRYTSARLHADLKRKDTSSLLAILQYATRARSY